MFQNHYQKGQNPWVFIFGVIVILSILFTMFSQRKQDTLDVYNTSDKIQTEEIKPVEEELDIEMDIYTDNQNNFSISIPKDWQQITKDGFQTFVHSPSASSIQIQVLDYTPDINNASADILSAQIAEDGKTFLNFTRETSSSYELMYQDFQNTTYDYIEEVYWDRETIIKLVCTFNDANYEKIIPYYEQILNSFSWQRKNEIPEGYAVYYHADAGFEVLMPDKWTIGASDAAVIATDPESGATQTITRIESATYLDTVTATDMAGLLKSGYSNFMMNSYENSKDSAIAYCTYVIGNIQRKMDVYAFATGTYIYFIAFDYEDGTIPADLGKVCAGGFRDFLTEIPTESSTDTENESKNQE